jgi:hypothetical protein
MRRVQRIAYRTVQLAAAFQPLRKLIERALITNANPVLSCRIRLIEG